MQAKYRGRCGKCGLPINIGEEISWSRQERGKVYHIACRTVPVERAAGAPAPLVPTSDVALAELIKKLLASTVAPAAVPVDVPLDEPDESDFASGIAHVPGTVPIPGTTPVVSAPVAQTRTPRAAKLTNSSAWYEVLHAVLPHVNRVLLVGPPSTGKSTTAMLLADTKHRVTMTETTSREDLIGMFHLIDGATKYVNGPFTNAMQNGEAVLVDEIDRYSAECASLLYSLIDDRPHIGLPNGELVEAKDTYKVVMTTNETIDTLPVAVQDRIEVIICANVPHRDAIGHLGKAAQAVTMRYYSAIPAPTIKLHPTVRRMRTFHRLLGAGIPNEIAARLVFGNAGAAEVLSAITSAEGDSRE